MEIDANLPAASKFTLAVDAAGREQNGTRVQLRIGLSKLRAEPDPYSAPLDTGKACRSSNPKSTRFRLSQSRTFFFVLGEGAKRRGCERTRKKRTSPPHPPTHPPITNPPSNPPTYPLSRWSSHAGGLTKLHSVGAGRKAGASRERHVPMAVHLTTLYGEGR